MGYQLSRCVTVYMLTGGPACSAAMPVLRFLSGPKWVFRPAGASRCPNKRDIWYRVADRGQMSRLSEQKCGNTAPGLSKFGILAINLSPTGDSSQSSAQFLQNS